MSHDNFVKSNKQGCPQRSLTRVLCHIAMSTALLAIQANAVVASPCALTQLGPEMRCLSRRVLRNSDRPSGSTCKGQEGARHHGIHTVS